MIRQLITLLYETSLFHKNQSHQKHKLIIMKVKYENRYTILRKPYVFS